MKKIYYIYKNNLYYTDNYTIDDIGYHGSGYYVLNPKGVNETFATWYEDKDIAISNFIKIVNNQYASKIQEIQELQNEVLIYHNFLKNINNYEIKEYENKFKNKKKK